MTNRDYFLLTQVGLRLDRLGFREKLVNIVVRWNCMKASDCGSWRMKTWSHAVSSCLPSSAITSSCWQRLKMSVVSLCHLFTYYHCYHLWSLEHV